MITTLSIKHVGLFTTKHYIFPVDVPVGVLLRYQSSVNYVGIRDGDRIFFMYVLENYGLDQTYLTTAFSDFPKGTVATFTQTKLI